MATENTPSTEEIKESSNFIHDFIDEDLAEGKYSKIQTRFPPEPNGYLHIGHAKAICINFGVKEKYKGICNLRLDDTNPTKEDVEYVDAIKEDIKWLGFDWDNVYYASDYFDFLYLNLVRNEKRKPKGVGQLLKNVQRIRTGEFQRRWDPACPKDAIVYPILVLTDAKRTMSGIKNLLQYWQKEEYSFFSIDGANIMPVVLTDIATICLYAKTFAENSFRLYLYDYYKKSLFDNFRKSNELTDLFNGLASFPDYMKTRHNDGIV